MRTNGGMPRHANARAAATGLLLPGGQDAPPPHLSLVRAAVRAKGRPAAAADPGSASQRAERLYRTYGPAVYRRCLRLLRSRDAALDATQDVFVKLVRQLPRVEERGSVLPWLYRVSTNHCLNTLRTAHFRGEDRLEQEYDLVADPAGDDLPDRLLARELLACFDDVTQVVAVAVLVDGMEHEEVGELVGLSRRSVARKLERFHDSARVWLSAVQREPAT